MIDDESNDGANQKPSEGGKKPYDVGYGKPPKHSRFKPGQSGNPKGKAKGQKSGRSIFRKTAFEMKTVDTADGLKRMPMYEAIVRKLAAAAAKGDIRAQIAFISLVKEGDPHDEVAEAFSKAAMAALSEEDMAILKRHDRDDGKVAR